MSPVLSYHYSHTHRTLSALVDGQPLGYKLCGGPFGADTLASFKATCEAIVNNPRALAAQLAFVEAGRRAMPEIAAAAMADRREREAARAGVGA